jgi:toxin ParE1/3/4
LPRLKMLPSAMTDLVKVLDGVTRETGSLDIGLRFVSALRQPCATLASLPGLHGRACRELHPDIRSVAFDSVPFNNYAIFFRYVEETFEVVNIVNDDYDTCAGGDEAADIRW